MSKLRFTSLKDNPQNIWRNQFALQLLQFLKLSWENTEALRGGSSSHYAAWLKAHISVLWDFPTVLIPVLSISNINSICTIGKVNFAGYTIQNPPTTIGNASNIHITAVIKILNNVSCLLKSGETSTNKDTALYWGSWREEGLTDSPTLTQNRIASGSLISNWIG